MSRTLSRSTSARLRRAAALGALQGVTEVLPVSSSAHLALLPWWRRWPADPSRTTLAAGLHAGSALGIAVALRRDLRELTRTRDGWRTIAMVGVASLPAAAVGRVVDDAVEHRLGRPAQLAGLVAGAGMVLAWADRRPATRAVGPVDAVVAGVAQVAALVPGVSRGGATLTALRLRGVDRRAATRFSLLMSLPVTVGAAGLTLVRADRALLREVATPLAVGVPISAAVAQAAVSRVSAAPPLVLALYRLGLGAAVAAELHRRRSQP
jgi:undecaprenyl-diphosphatase